MTYGVCDICDIKKQKFSRGKYLVNSYFPQFPIISFETRPIYITLIDTPVRNCQERPARLSRTASATVKNSLRDSQEQPSRQPPFRVSAPALRRIGFLHTAYRLRRCRGAVPQYPTEPFRRTPEPTPPQKYIGLYPAQLVVVNEKITKTSMI